MHPLRVLFLILLVFLLFRLLGRRKKPDRNRNLSDSKISVKQDILIEDPVCHTYVPKSQAVSLELDEKFYYFCSKKCRDAFRSKEEEST